MAIREFGGIGGLEEVDLPRPRAARGEILVRVVAAGVNPVDWMICRGDLRDVLPHRFPLIPGWDVSGVVDELGEDATRMRKGDRVWAFAKKPTVQWGCYAQYVAVAEDAVALMPAKLLFEEAAAVPASGLTALQALARATSLGPGSSALVHAAGGGVGHLMLQLARHTGARVFGTAGPDKQSFVSTLGATGVVDYTPGDWAESLRRHCPDGFDFVLDTVGGDTLRTSFSLLKPGGALVSLVEEPDAALSQQHGVQASLLIARPSGEQLADLARRVDRGELRPHVDKIHPLAEARAALEASRGGHVKGKLVLAL